MVGALRLNGWLVGWLVATSQQVRCDWGIQTIFRIRAIPIIQFNSISLFQTVSVIQMST